MTVTLAENPRTAIQARIKRATLAAQAATNRLDANTLAAAEQAYKRAAADIRQRIAMHTGPSGNVALSELRNLLGQVDFRLSELSQQRDLLLQNRLSTAAELGAKPFAPEAFISTAASMQIHDDALSFVRNFIAEDGLQLSDRIWRLDRHARDTVAGAIEQAVIQGHGAEQAAAEFLSRGDRVPPDVLTKINAANGTRIGNAVESVLVQGEGSPMDNALRLFRTEINRAHGVAYQRSVAELDDAVGTRFILSPNHPRHDICDLLSTQNLYGLGPGVYPKGKSPWPAHPNTLSYEEVVFDDEVSAADRAGKETSLQALDRLSAAKQRGVLGVNKHEVFKAGGLTRNMIRAPWKAVQARIEKSGVLRKTIETARQAVASVADDVQAALTWLNDNIAQKVRLPSATSDQLQSLRTGFDKVLSTFGVRVGTLRWKRRASRANASYGHFSFGHLSGENDFIEFNRSYAANARSQAAKSKGIFEQLRAGGLAQTEMRLAAPDLTPAQRRALKSKLAQLKASTRWSASSIADDPLSTTAAHEAGHALNFVNERVDIVWLRELKANKVTKIDRLRVSEYASTKPQELFAEVTAFIAIGRRNEIPRNILRAYDAALKEIN